MLLSLLFYDMLQYFTNFYTTLKKTLTKLYKTKAYAQQLKTSKHKFCKTKQNTSTTLNTILQNFSKLHKIHV